MEFSIDPKNGRIVRDAQGNKAATFEKVASDPPAAWKRAKLFVAAPGLLEACNLFMRFDGENCQQEGVTYDDVKAAIQKAIAHAQAETER